MHASRPQRPRPPGPGPEREHGPHTLKVWQGTVVGAWGDDVFVELGPRMQGVISRRQFAEPPAIGQVFEFTLRGQEEGLWALARRDQKSLSTWEEIERGSLVQARVIREAPAGLELKVGPLHAFMPKSHTGLPREQRAAVLVGKVLTCEVIEVDAERQRVVLSRKLVQQREREGEHQRQIGALAPGELVHGRVTRVEPYGIFVGFGQGLEGLVHVSNLAHERVADPRERFKKGDPIEARVLAIKAAGKRIALGIKQLSASPWAGLDARVAPGEIVAGTVQRVMHFGAFVSVASGVEGLLPRAHAGLREGDQLEQLLKEGQRVSVRVLSIDRERERMTVSLLRADGTRIAFDEAENVASYAARPSAPTNGHSLRAVLESALRRTGDPQRQPRP